MLYESIALPTELARRLWEVRKKRAALASASFIFPRPLQLAHLPSRQSSYLGVGERQCVRSNVALLHHAGGQNLRQNPAGMKRFSSSREPPADSSVLSGRVSRRDFLRSLGTTAVSATALGARSLASELAQVNAEKIHGPGAVPVTLSINGERRALAIEPRVTLLEALRMHAGLTGTKESCDRATCGACTVLLNGEPVYACSVLAIEAQGAEIETIEGLTKSGELTRLQHAFVDKDGLQCGYCTPGFVLTLTALLRKNPHPTEAEIRRASAGNLCRCGSQPRIIAAALAAGGSPASAKARVIRLHDHALA
jgi:xanthine dehydrogenase YagT iron-sulfur-binding subunit